MEEFKPRNKILEPDERLSYFGLSLDSLYSRAAGIVLNQGAPEAVHNQFTIARSALVYSWYFYPFLPVALLYSFLAIELALSIRLKSHNPELFRTGRDLTLFPLLANALKERWICDSGFNLQISDDFAVPENVAKQFPRIPLDQRFSYSLLNTLVGLRNDLAHGTYMLTPGMAPLLDRGAEIINQLYPAAIANK